MTREDAWRRAKGYLYDALSGEEADEIIKALEQESCENAINRQALLDAFGFSEKTRKWGGDHSGYNTMMLYEIQDVIESQPPVNPQEPKWIPVSERLPEKDDLYLINFDDGEYDLVYFCKGAFSYSGVIAWMPLPEPYKAESEDKE